MLENHTAEENVCAADVWWEKAGSKVTADLMPPPLSASLVFEKPRWCGACHKMVGVKKMDHHGGSVPPIHATFTVSHMFVLFWVGRETKPDGYDGWGWDSNQNFYGTR